MRIAVFGRTGQLATELARRAPAGVTLQVLGRETADFARPDAVRAAARALRADAAINAVAESEEPLAMAVNGAAVGALGEGCAAAGVPLVHVSTDYVFDGSGEEPRAPDAPPAPLGAYGRSKLAGEAALRASGAAHAILRTSWVFSAHGANFVRTMTRLGAERAAVRIVADQIGGPTPAAALADACFAAAARLAAEPGLAGTYHFAGAPDTSWAGFAREIFARAGLSCAVEEIPTADYPTPARRPLNSRLDCSATQAAFGLPRPDWRAGLDDVLKELS